MTDVPGSFFRLLTNPAGWPTDAGRGYMTLEAALADLPPQHVRVLVYTPEGAVAHDSALHGVPTSVQATTEGVSLQDEASEHAPTSSQASPRRALVGSQTTVIPAQADPASPGSGIGSVTFPSRPFVVAAGIVVTVKVGAG